MTSRDFCYWLQGFFEVDQAGQLEGNQILTEPQVEVIKKHLNMVFYHEIDPSMGDKEHQGKLQALHQGLPITLTSEGLDSSIVEQGSTVEEQVPYHKINHSPFNKESDLKYRC